MEILNRQAIKAQARDFIGVDRRWLYMALACLPLTLLSGAIGGGIELVKQFFEEGETVSYSISSGSSIITLLLIPFTISMAGYFLNHLRGFNPNWKSLYREGIDHYGKYFVVGFLTDLIIGLWTLLFIIPGFIKAYQYYFVHQIIHDNPNLDQTQARDLSKRMTDGFKGELFILGLSFLPWILLEIITLGIAGLYVLPYMQCTNAMYYENLKHNAIVSGIATPEEFGIFPVPEENFENNSPLVNDDNTVEYSAPVVEENNVAEEQASDDIIE